MTNALTNELNVQAVPEARAMVRIPQVRVYRHSTMFYWWPAWAFGFAIALINEGQERIHTISESQREGSALGLSYVCILLLLIVFTNVRLRGIYSVVTLLAIAFIGVVLAWFGWWDDIAKLIPYLSVQMNTGF
jgi:hypothetical protein